MCQPLCQVKFLGGPYDGAVVTLDDHTYPRTIFMPARPISISPKGEPCCVTLDDSRSVYRLNRKARAASDGGTTLRYECVFTGFKTPRDQTRNTDPPRAMIGPLAALAVVLRRCRDKAVRWMLAPVDQPLKLAK